MTNENDTLGGRANACFSLFIFFFVFRFFFFLPRAIELANRIFSIRLPHGTCPKSDGRLSFAARAFVVISFRALVFFFLF